MMSRTIAVNADPRLWGFSGPTGVPSPGSNWPPDRFGVKDVRRPDPRPRCGFRRPDTRLSPGDDESTVFWFATGSPRRSTTSRPQTWSEATRIPIPTSPIRAPRPRRPMPSIDWRYHRPG